VSAPYPTIPAGARTGLLLFGAAFKGENDGQYLRAAGLTCSVVDTDPARLSAMEKEYPPTWAYVCADAFRFVHDAVLRGARYDVVSADPFTGEATRTLRLIPALEALTNMMLVVGIEELAMHDHRTRGYETIKRNASWRWLVSRRVEGVK
jgi:hypothetical protein